MARVRHLALVLDHHRDAAVRHLVRVRLRLRLSVSQPNPIERDATVARRVEPTPTPAPAPTPTPTPALPRYRVEHARAPAVSREGEAEGVLLELVVVPG